MDNKKLSLQRGDIVWVDLGEHPGSHVQSGRRPCIIVNTNKSNGDVYTVIPGSSKFERKHFPVHLVVTPQEVKGSLSKETVFMMEQITTVDKRDIILKTGFLQSDSEIMKSINNLIIRQLELII